MWIFLIFFILLKICNFVTDCHQCANLNLVNITEIWQQRELKNHCKKSSDLRGEMASFHARFSLMWKQMEATGEKDEMKVSTPMSGFPEQIFDGTHTGWGDCGVLPE